MTGKCIEVKDEGQEYDRDYFMIPKHYEDSIDHVMVPHGLILNRVEKMARDIHEESSDSITILCILKGGVRFCQDLMQYLNVLNGSSGRSVHMNLEYIRVKSYKNTSSGEVTITGSQDLDLKGKHLLIVEDLIDTGKTMSKLLTCLKGYEPTSIRVATLLRKRCPNSTGYIPDYCGFEVPNKFVIGYAVDYNEHFRDLDHICVINETGIEKYAVE